MALPFISFFISEKSPPLIFNPPVSNITPLPIKTIGLSFFLTFFLYSILINNAGLELPLFTAKIKFKPIFFNCLSFKTLIFKYESLFKWAVIYFL